MQLREALGQVDEIRRQIARNETYRGFRSVPVAFSGLLALAAAGLQSIWIPNPTENIFGYLALWIGVAIVSILAVGAQIVRGWNEKSALRRQTTLLALEQFLPCLIAGALLTLVLELFAPGSGWLLPGLWSILFSQGIFASCQLFPRPIFWVGSYYLMAGLCSLALARGADALSPWAMGLAFGIGQLLSAAVLYITLEHGDDGR